MTDTYRLVHATKPNGLHSKIDPDEPWIPGARWSRRLRRSVSIVKKNMIKSVKLRKNRDLSS